MKTQRMDAEFRRAEQEIKRRDLQRDLHYTVRKEAHKKLYSRVLAKNALEGLEQSTMKMFEDLNYFKDDVEEAIEGEFYDWLIDETVQNLDRRLRIEEVIHHIAEEVPRDLSDIHYHFVEMEHKRIQRIQDDAEEKQRKFEKDRRIRREKRQLQRISRKKGRLRDEIKRNIVDKRSLEPDIFGLKVVTYNDEEAELKKFRTYGGLIYEIWAVLSLCKLSVNQRAETPFERFLQDDDIRKFILSYLSEQNLKDRGFRLNIAEEYHGEIEEAQRLMESNLFEFNEQKEQIIENIIQHQDLITGFGIQVCNYYNRFDGDLLKIILRNIFRVYFKSNDYKLPEEAPVLADQTVLLGEDNKRDESIIQQTTEGGQLLQIQDTEVQPPEAGEAGDGNQQSLLLVPGEGTSSEMIRRGSSHIGTAKKLIPEITDEDRRVESLKKKLDIVFLTREEANRVPDIDAIARIREPLDRENIRPEIKAARDEEKERIRQEIQAIEDPRRELSFHRRQYLLDEYMNQLRNKELQEQRETQEAEERKNQEKYTELYYGDQYDRDYAVHMFEEGDQVPSNINENLSLSDGRSVLFIHRVNQGLLRKAIVDKVRELFKEMALIKDVNIDEKIMPVDNEVEGNLLATALPYRESIPIFDIELEQKN